MAQYYLLADLFINGNYLNKGTFQSTQDVGGVIPAAWVPCPDVDPVDAAAIFAYFSAGPQMRGVINTQFTTLPVNPPKYIWNKDSNGRWNLSGIYSLPIPGTLVITTDQGVVITDNSGRILVTP